jgi:PAS domain S-box-containing protein
VRVLALELPPATATAAFLLLAAALLLLWQSRRWRRAEQGLQRYGLLARHTRDIILFIRRRDGRILEVNDAAVAAYRCGRETLLASTIHDLRAPDGQTLIDGQMAHADVDGTLFESVHRRMTGEVFPVEVSSRGTTIGGERVLLSVIRDITERIAAADALRDSERRLTGELRARVAELERVLALTPAGVLIAEDPACTVLRANAALQRMLGLPDTNFSMTGPDRISWRMCRNGKDLASDEMPIQRCASQAVDVPPEECDIVFDDGRVINLLVSATPLRGEDGAPAGAVAVMVDISQQKGTEQTLKAQADRLHLQGVLMERAHDAIIVRNDFGRILLWNTGATQLYGWSAAEAVGRNIHEVLGTNRRALDEIYRNVRKPGVDEWQGQMRHVRRDGTEVIVDSRHVRVEQSGATPIMEINRDITDRVRAEAERVHTMERLRVLLDISEAMSAAATPEEIVSVVLEKVVPAVGAYAGNVALLAPNGTEMEILGAVGYDAAASTGARLPLAMASPLADAITGNRLVMIRSRDEWATRYPEMFRQRVEAPTHALAAIPLRAEQTVGALGLSFKTPGDLPERDRAVAALVARQAAQALERASLLTSERQAHAEATEASRLKDEFLATLSHELRTPLNAILGWSHMLTTGALKAESRDRALEVIARNASVQARLVEEVLDLSRMATGSLRLEAQNVDMATVVERAVDTVRLAAGAKGVELALSIDGDIRLLGDADRLQQVVWNLLSNGVKFTPRGGRVDLIARRSDAVVEIEVRDTGIGIERAFLPHVFDRFTQADSSPTRRFGGLGLGLAIVREIVELHGGTVSAASEGPSRGASFRISLPVQTTFPADLPVPAVVADLEARHLALEGLRVLAVDDDPDSRDLLESTLGTLGASVSVAGSVAEARELLNQRTPDLLISDIGMPDEDGYVLIGYLRQQREPVGTIPAIALTAYGSSADRAQALSAGFDQHVAKPVRPAELASVVARVTGRGEASPSQ